MGDVDLALRQVSRRFPRELVKALTPPGTVLGPVRWLESNLISLERRLDRVLLATLDGEPTALHVEWAWRWSRYLPFRMFEYHALTAISLHVDLLEERRRWRERGRSGVEPEAPKVSSLVVLLSGRKLPWPSEHDYRSTPLRGLQGGLTFGVQPVYQRSVAQLEATGSILSLVLAPLAHDVTPASLASVALTVSRRCASDEERAEAGAAMTILAGALPRPPGLLHALTASFPKELVMRSAIYTMGREDGRREGLQQGREEALREAITTVCSLLSIPVTKSRRAWLQSATGPQLEARLASLRAHRAWSALDG